VNLVLRERNWDIVRVRKEVEALHCGDSLARPKDQTGRTLGDLAASLTVQGLELLIDDGPRLLALAVTLRSRALF